MDNLEKAKTPVRLTLEPGTYFWCACGKSKNQPFCDSSHRGSEFKPVQFKLTEKKEAWFCVCKKSQNPPWCDGSHKTVTAAGS